MYSLDLCKIVLRSENLVPDNIDRSGFSRAYPSSFHPPHRSQILLRLRFLGHLFSDLGECPRYISLDGRNVLKCGVEDRGNRFGAFERFHGIPFASRRTKITTKTISHFTRRSNGSFNRYRVAIGRNAIFLSPVKKTTKNQNCDAACHTEAE